MGSEIWEHVTDFSIDPKETVHTDTKLALIILNFKLPAFTPLVWAQATTFRICADGGANRLFDELPLLFPQEDAGSVRLRFVPEVIKGDLDSIRPEVREFYSSLGTIIIDQSEDQDSTDLHKCVLHVLENFSSVQKQKLKLLVVGALGGRIDHELGNFHVLYIFKDVEIVILSNHGEAFLLPAGYRHVIRPNRAWEGPHCGVIPLGEPSKCTTTTGLRWNLDARPMSFGTLVSSSNKVVADVATVESDVTLFWTIEFRAV